MNCPNCGAENASNSSFCIKCGSKLINDQANNLNQNISLSSNLIQNDGINVPNENYNQGIVYQNIKQAENIQANTNSMNNGSTSVRTGNELNYFSYIINILLKPIKTFKNEEKKFDTKTSLIFSGIVAVMLMIINLIKNIFSVILVKKFDYNTLKTKTSIEFSNLKNLEWFDLIVKRLLLFAAIIAVIALVYYLAGLVIKKEANYTKNLSIVSSALIPYALIGMVVAPLLSNIYEELYLIVLVIATIYSISIFITLINYSMKLENNDQTIYFHVICLSILIISSYYLYTKVLLTSFLESKISSSLNYFN